METTHTSDTEPFAGWPETRERLGRFIAARIGNPADAEDVLQDVLVRAVAGLEQLKDAARLHAWLYGIARNAIIDHYRRSGRAPARADVDIAALPAAEPEEDGAAGLLQCLEPMLRGLDDRDREVLELADRDGVSQKDLVERLGLSYSGAKSRVQRARARLRDRFNTCCSLERDRRGSVIEIISSAGSCADSGSDLCCEE